MESGIFGLLTEQETGDYLSLSPDTLRTWRWARKGPPYIKLKTGGVRYSQVDLDAWIAGQRVDPSASAVGE